MPQLHCYVSDELAEKVRLEAERSGRSVSRFLADVVTRAVQPTEGLPAAFWAEATKVFADFDVPRDDLLPLEERDWTDPNDSVPS